MLDMREPFKLAGVAALLLTSAQISTSQEATQPEVTVYNSGFAVVKEGRTLNLQTGRQTVAIEGVAEKIEPDSVAVKAVQGELPFSVLEQNYVYDLISPIAILNKAVGGTVIFNRVLPNGQTERIEGTLLSAPTQIVGGVGGNQSMTYNGLVIRTSDNRIILNPYGEIEVTSLPQGLISRPTLFWELQAQRAGAVPVQISYLTQGISWTASYVLTLDDAGTTGDLKGWVTLSNEAGATWENAQLKLIAGDVSRVKEQYEQAAMAGRGQGGFGADMQQEEFGDFHLYTMSIPTTIRNKEMKQVSLLEGNGINVTRRLEANSGTFGIRQSNSNIRDSMLIKPNVILTFRNSEENDLGVPIPAGIVKAYQPDSSGSLQLLGEDRIDHTPRDETIRLLVGQSFDVRVERVRTQFTRVSSTVFEETYEVEVRNGRNRPDKVYLYENFYGDWEILETTHPATQRSARTAEFEIDVPARGTTTLRYRVRVRTG